MRLQHTNTHIHTSRKEIDKVKSKAPIVSELPNQLSELSQPVESLIESHSNRTYSPNVRQEYAQYLMMRNRTLVKKLESDKGCMFSKSNNAHTIEGYNLHDYHDSDRDYDIPSTTTASSSSLASSYVIHPDEYPLHDNDDSDRDYDIPTITTADSTIENSTTANSNSRASSSVIHREEPPLYVFQVIKRDLNKNNICAGLSVEWLRCQKSIFSASERIAALEYDTNRHNTAEKSHKNYDRELHYLKKCSDYPHIDAISSLIEGANLKQIGPSKHIYSSLETADEIAKIIKEEGSAHLISLRFIRMTGHSIASSSKMGMTHIFDPQFGEFSSSNEQVLDLVKSLLSHYQSLDQEIGGVNVFRVN